MRDVELRNVVSLGVLLILSLPLAPTGAADDIGQGLRILGPDELAQVRGAQRQDEECIINSLAGCPVNAPNDCIKFYYRMSSPPCGVAFAWGWITELKWPECKEEEGEECNAVTYPLCQTQCGATHEWVFVSGSDEAGWTCQGGTNSYYAYHYGMPETCQMGP